MEIGKYYKVIGECDFYPELQPEGTIVKCIEDKGNNFFIVQLIDNCGKKIDDVWGWLTKDNNKFRQIDIKNKI